MPSRLPSFEQSQGIFGLSLERQHVDRDRHPGLAPFRPNVRNRFHPRGIVERAGFEVDGLGRLSLPWNSREPHPSQNSQKTSAPLSAGRHQRFILPFVIFTDAVGNVTLMQKALALCFWQSRQWQTYAVAGSAAISNLTAPHWQPPT